MILYGSYTSPYVRHCRVELAAAGYDYEFVETDYQASFIGSPTKRVPYFKDGDVKLTDSSSILLYLKHKQREDFILNAQEMELYALANTALETAINLFLLEKEGQTPANNDYLSRQQARVNTTLEALNQFEFTNKPPFSVAEIRLACLLDWGLYRGRFSLDGLDRLSELLQRAKKWQPFAEVAPPVL